MGFDNECIVNIQTLAGEYFCPVCRLLVYPNEALQSQCTHLYCKPCLTYVVGTTRACPYDGYLVTEPDSKPLLESNKALADIIGRIGVRCLYHRSGCQWQGPLSDCTTHCSGCAFGNSAVVCNRCAVQIVHRQVQEHALTCPGVQPQVAQADGTQNLAATATSAPANSGQPQTATQTVAANSVAPIPATGQDPNIQTGLNPQPQANGVSIGAVPTPEQLYQQQYYQQYPGYDPYQQAYQHYYPYPQQPQVYSQPQQVPQQPMQSQTPVQTQVPPQLQGQAQPQPIQNVNPQYQTPAQMIPQGQQQSQGYPYPYSQPQPSQTHPQLQQMPQFPQAQPQMQQNYPQMPPQPHPQAPQQSQQTQPQVQQQLTQALTGHHSYPQPQQMQMGTQQRPNMHTQSGPTPHLPPHQHGQYPPQSHPQVPIHQFPPQNQVPGAPAAQQQPPNLYAQQPGHPPMQQMPHPQSSSGLASGHVQNQLTPHGQLPPPPPLQPQLYQQPQNYSARPVMQNHEVQSQAIQQSLSGYPGQPQARPPYIGKNQQFPNENHQLRSGNQVQINESPSQRTASKETDGKKNESVDSFKLRGNEAAKETGSELHTEENKPFETSAAEQTNDSDLSQKGENLTSGDKSKEGGAYTELQAHTSEENKSGQLHGQVHLSMQYPPTHQQRPTMLQPSFPSVPPHHPQVPGQPLNMLRPQGPGQPFNQHPDHVQQHGRPPSQFVPHERNFELQHSGDPRIPFGNTSGLLNPTGGFMGRPPFYGAEGQFGQQRPIGLAGNEFFQDPRPRYLDGQSPGQSQGRNLKEFMGTDERFNPSADRVSRTLEKEPFGLESGGLAANRFLPPYEAGRGNFGHARPDFFRPVQGFGPNHFDRYASRSPGREPAGFLPRDFGDFPRIRPGMGNFEGQSRPFDGGRRPFGQFQRGELEGPGFQGPRSLPGHLRLGENFPPYRPLNSSYPPPGSLDPFDNPRKRLPPNNGWCRICKVDCEGVEGLEMHSQTREHQDMAMDMVRSIKLQNSKKQKMSNDRSSLEELSKKRGAGYEVPGDKL